MLLKSNAFGQGEEIPPRYTCEGENISPPLSIEEVPGNTKSMVLIVDDPDVPKQIREDRMFDHWVLFNIDPSTRSIEENTAPGTQGNNTRGSNAYTGPCPPVQFEPKRHRYFFKGFALDCTLDCQEGGSKKEVEKAMQGHILDQAKLMGTYQKKG